MAAPVSRNATSKPSKAVSPAGRVQADAENFAAASRNPALKHRVGGLLTSMLDLYEWTMNFGTREEQMSLMRSALPGIVKGVETAEAEERETAMQQSYARLRVLFAEKIKNPVVIAVGDDDDD